MSENNGSVERLLTARAQPPPSPIRLRAGDFGLVLVGGDLRYLCASGTEVVRRVYVAVRDLNWNTLPGVIEGLQVRDGGNSFDVTFVCRHRFGPIDYRWSAAIIGDRSGCIRYEMSGEALTRFPYAKIGICVHHPIEGFKGMAYSGVSPAGPLTGTLPETVGPQVNLDDGTDLPLFDPVSELRLNHLGGGVVTFEFSGDLWEMEDQRNWTDQSFKSASTPASLGYRHEALPGQKFHQMLTISATGFAPVALSPADSVRVGSASGTVVPEIGMSCPTPTEALSPAARELFALIRPAHLRVDVDLDAGDKGLDRRRRGAGRRVADQARARSLRNRRRGAPGCPRQIARIGGHLQASYRSDPVVLQKQGIHIPRDGTERN